MAFEYINEYYGLDVKKGIPVIVNGKRGVITKDMGNYIGVTFDDEKDSGAYPCHPTWKVDYDPDKKFNQ